jgi:hypothetical protein
MTQADQEGVEFLTFLMYWLKIKVPVLEANKETNLEIRQRKQSLYTVAMLQCTTMHYNAL